MAAHTLSAKFKTELITPPPIPPMPLAPLPSKPPSAAAVRLRKAAIFCR